jgi:hypothetical protein
MENRGLPSLSICSVIGQCRLVPRMAGCGWVFMSRTGLKITLPIERKGSRMSGRVLPPRPWRDAERYLVSFAIEMHVVN